MEREEEVVAETCIDSQVHVACVMEGRRLEWHTMIQMCTSFLYWKSGQRWGYPLIDLDSNDEAPVLKSRKLNSFSYEQVWHRVIYLEVATMDDGFSVKERICFK